MNEHLGPSADFAGDDASSGAPVSVDTYRVLLEKAARLHDQHEPRRHEPFNVFSVLRSEYDEVNLHSRFLAALLGHRKSPGQSLENLADFLQRFEISGFDHDDDARVDREWNNIALLVRDQSSMQAVIIENKILAADQPEQLARYAKQMQEYRTHVLYLTLDGREASEDSAGGIDYQCISYRDHIVPWLKGCQQRAYDEPELRESVAQYVRLIEKLTGTDFSEAYMNDLKDLCLQDNNIVLVHDLRQAMDKAKISLLERLWKEIESELRAGITDLPAQSKESDISEERIRQFVTKQRSYGGHGLYFGFEQHAKLGVEVDDSIFFGVRCDDEQWSREFRSRAAAFSDWPSWKHWPLYRYPLHKPSLKYTSREQLELLVNEESRRHYVEEVVTGTSALWNRLKEEGLVETG
ncbi:MAG: PD-(D/E)XK nuclease family protein [Rhodospirillales bacterium]|nr:PD-(D/E)XK nuclease family protein [Rhodospirillales bacterium]